MTKQEIDSIIVDIKTKNNDSRIFMAHFPDSEYSLDITSVNAYEYLSVIIEQYGFTDKQWYLYIPTWYAYKLLLDKFILNDSIYNVNMTTYVDRLFLEKEQEEDVYYNIYGNISYLYLTDGKKQYYQKVKPIMEP